MTNLPTRSLVCSFFIVLVLHSFSATSHEVKDEREFSYSATSPRGPARWGEIHAEWGACSHGKMQSPIDMSSERVDMISRLGSFKRSYKLTYAVLRNRGHDMMLRFEAEAGCIEINGTVYALRQCHWHSPSEHTINRIRYDLELHLVHESADGRIAVVGILYKIGAPDSFLSSLTDDLAAVTDITGGERDVGVIDPRVIKIGSGEFYRYIGSLTVPPCTENVLWNIAKKVRTVTWEQLILLRVAVHDESNTNARPLQAINKRSIELYRVDDDYEEEN
ncbi:alpha carbonic anhydrase 2 [Hibiscus trionum]|uniref:Carbonic anhydrase n=1 Tax=Hibiscus trionum TaxID=183268 RepID=A0A9W7I935_HIBTR|nr:alpha carbonic anhydrase 2 [Hibiscus trionum]